MRWFDRCWKGVLRWLRILWICRVSVLSVLVGLLLAGFAVQVQDLFVDLSASWLYWAVFFLLLFVAWSVPVHYAARLLLQFDFGVIPRQEAADHRTAIQAVPRGLGCLCYVAVALAIGRAWFNLPGCDDGAPACLDVADQARTRLVALGVADIVVLALFVWVIRNRRWLAHLASLLINEAWIGSRLALARTLGGGPAAMAGPGAQRARRRGNASRARADDRATPLLPYYRGNAARYRGKPVPPGADPSNRLSGATWGGLLLLAFISVSTLAALLASPATLAGWVPRACLLVLVLGAWVPFAGYLAYWAHIRRFPVLLAAVLLPGFASLFIGDSHDVRRLLGAEMRHLRLDEAVALWRAANPGDNRPIVVASAGGASRAGYMTARLLAQVGDADPSFARRLFAVSGVSGGSVGAAFYAAARQAQAPGGLAAEAAAGDFMSPVFAGFALRDVLGIPLLADRAVWLERAWEASFAAVAGSDGMAAPFATLLPDADAWRPLLLLNAASAGTGRRVVVSHLANFDELTQRPLFADAYTYDELAPGTADLRLSTAAGLSARFPLMTPAAGVPELDGSLRDRLVDGGYYENFGAQTAHDLVDALERRGLRPVVLQISNDPGLTLYQPPARPAAGPVALSSVLVPLRAFMATRGAHGTGASVKLRNALCPVEADDAGPGGELKACARWAHVRLTGRAREVSMSWWLSEPVRFAIDGQLCGEANTAAVRRLLGDRAADGMCS